MVEIDIEQLISEVAKYEILWNPRTKLYKNTKITDRKWAEVAFNFGLDPDTAGPDCKKKFKSVKDWYRKELTMPQPRSGSSGAEGDLSSTWPYFSLCGFLNDVMPKKKASDNFKSNSAVPESENIRDDNAETLSDDELDSPHSSTTTDRDADLTFVPPLRRTIKSHQMESLISMENKRLKLIETHLNKQSGSVPNLPTADPDFQFLHSLLPYFQDLTALEKLQLRTKIQSAVLEFHEQRVQPVVMVSQADIEGFNMEVHN